MVLCFMPSSSRADLIYGVLGGRSMLFAGDSGRPGGRGTGLRRHARPFPAEQRHFRFRGLLPRRCIAPRALPSPWLPIALVPQATCLTLLWSW